MFELIDTTRIKTSYSVVVVVVGVDKLGEREKEIDSIHSIHSCCCQQKGKGDEAKLYST